MGRCKRALSAGLTVFLAALSAGPWSMADGGVDRADGGTPPALVFLGQIEVESHLGDSAGAAAVEKGALSGPMAVTLLPTRRGGGMFGELIKRTHAKAGPDGSLKFDASSYPVSIDRVAPRHRSASFVLDFDEPAVQRAKGQAEHAYGGHPTVRQVSQFVDGYIDKKDMERAFDIASQVAARKEGDCTEHAVLLAAMLRSFGYAARVVQGLAIVPIEGRPAAFGHAWVEYHDGKGWKPADAAISVDLGARYVPLEVIEDEGPAFERHMLETTGALLEVRRVVLDPVSTAH